MVINILFAVFCIVCIASLVFFERSANEQLEKQRSEWYKEREKLLDRIIANSLSEYKAQIRADTPIKRKEKDSTTKNLEKERWL